MSRFHPSRWPLPIWVVASIAAAYIRVGYTLGSFSFAPAVALLAGTWLGSRRGALSQALGGAAQLGLALTFPGTAHAGEWGFVVGLIGAAALAGHLATPDGNGAHPAAPIRTAVFGVAGGTAALVLAIVPRLQGTVGVYFALTFLLASAIAVFYAYRMVPEPWRVVGYFFCLLPYYAAGLAWNWSLPRIIPAVAAAAGIPDRWQDMVFHAYLAHLPGELIALVVIAYLVCAVDRNGASDGPLAVGASR